MKENVLDKKAASHIADYMYKHVIPELAGYKQENIGIALAGVGFSLLSKKDVLRCIIAALEIQKDAEGIK